MREERARKGIVVCDLFPPLSLTSPRGTAPSDTGEWEDCLCRWLKVVDFFGTYVPYTYVCAIRRTVYRWGGVDLSSKVIVDIFRLETLLPISGIHEQIARRHFPRRRNPCDGITRRSWRMSYRRREAVGRSSRVGRRNLWSRCFPSGAIACKCVNTLEITLDSFLGHVKCSSYNGNTNSRQDSVSTVIKY